ncbi:MAG: MFS transporter, partial [Veillonella sp.]|nr:MFS transporter [Veillonella sp.]
NPLVALVCICLSSVGVYGGMGVWWTVPTTFLSGAAAAGAMSLINSCGNLGGLVGPAMLGHITTLTGSTDLGFYIMGVAMLVAGVLVLTLPREKTVARDL